MITIQELALLTCGLPLIAFCVGVMVGLLLAMFRMSERDGTGRTPSMPAGHTGTDPFKARSKWGKSNDMLKK